jgi:isopenicillin-N N-acyltransferase-like protein
MITLPSLRFGSLGLALLVSLTLRAQQPAPVETPQMVLSRAIVQVVSLVEPPADAPTRSVTGRVKVIEAAGDLKSVAGREAKFSLQAPDRFRVAAAIDDRDLEMGRDGQRLWAFAPKKSFGVIGSADAPRYLTRPNDRDGTRLRRLKLPLPKEQLLMLPLLVQAEFLPPETINGMACKVVQATPQPAALEALKLPAMTLTVWVREQDQLPARVKLDDGKRLRLTLDLTDLALGDALPADTWKLSPPEGAKVETVALSQVARLVPALWSLLNQSLPTLGPVTGEREVLAREGAGWLEEQDGTRVLFLKGTPAEMGRQHGMLLRRESRDLVDKVLYGVGVGSSFEKGRWFFGEIQEAQARLMPFMDPRYLEEMDALAAAAGLEREQVRLANFFPELFHCSGFAVYGSATKAGRMYHGRVLDYLKGVGLEPNAVVIVSQPQDRFAWVNLGYAGFVGTVTAMNEKHISIGEMGGRGEGNWDGKPMAQLMREVMEKADSLDAAVDIMRRGPRTCEYYYVIADGKRGQAVGIAATPTTFEVVQAGEANPRLPHAIPDTVLLSAGDRYETLARRVKEQHGQLDADSARRLMDRPVAMNSNIQSVLLAPDTLDFWVANADRKNVASNTRYTHYNLGELLKRQPPAAAPSSSDVK